MLLNHRSKENKDREKYSRIKVYKKETRAEILEIAKNSPVLQENESTQHKVNSAYKEKFSPTWLKPEESMYQFEIQTLTPCPLLHITSFSRETSYSP